MRSKERKPGKKGTKTMSMKKITQKEFDVKVEIKKVEKEKP